MRSLLCDCLDSYWSTLLLGCAWCLATHGIGQFIPSEHHLLLGMESGLAMGVLIVFLLSWTHRDWPAERIVVQIIEENRSRRAAAIEKAGETLKRHAAEADGTWSEPLEPGQ